MRPRDILIFYSLVCTLGVWTTSCTLLKSNRSKTIVTIDGTPVSTDEFLYIYNKNNLNDGHVSRKEIRDYLDLFVNFKLKVREAEILGLDKDSLFIEELEGYRKQLANPYLTETRLLDSLAGVTYGRLHEEINASHILIRTPLEAPPADTLAAFEKIADLREKIVSGEDFGQMATKYSEDPSAGENKGNLGYFSAMQMVYPFEEAAYGLSIDSISQPVRTNFGYHLIKVHDRRPSQGKIQVSHILVRALESLSSSDSTLAANRAWEIYQRAKNKEDWELLCRQFSEDVGTKMKGGTLPLFKTGDISNIPSFEKAAFELEKIGDISMPVRTAYGWHIIRLDSRQALESFDALKPKIRANLSANSRARLNQQELVKRLKVENNFKENQEVISEALSYANDSLINGSWQPHYQWGNQQKVLFSIEKISYKVESFYQYVQQKQPLKNDSEPVEMMRKAYISFYKECLINYEDDHLADKYYDYKMLYKEYRDGILLFQLMETKVWNQAVKDTSGLRIYFEGNQDHYQWGSRAVATIFNVADQDALDEVGRFLEQGYFDYGKFDFYGTSGSFNKAQLGILDNVSQFLLQGEDRYLVLKYHSGDKNNQQIYNDILDHLSRFNIGADRIEIISLDKGAQEFLMFVASNSIKDLEENINKKNPLTIQVESGNYQQGDSHLVDQVEWEKGNSTLGIDNRLVLVAIKEILPGGDQDLQEIKGQVISDYQTKLEIDWVAELRAKYQIDIYENQVDAVYDQYNN